MSAWIWYAEEWRQKRIELRVTEQIADGQWEITFFAHTADKWWCTWAARFCQKCTRAFKLGKYFFSSFLWRNIWVLNQSLSLRSQRITNSFTASTTQKRKEMSFVLQSWEHSQFDETKSLLCVVTSLPLLFIVFYAPVIHNFKTCIKN